MTDIEFGGNDLLQVYNVAQIKHRLNTTGTVIDDYNMTAISETTTMARVRGTSLTNQYLMIFMVHGCIIFLQDCMLYLQR